MRALLVFGKLGWAATSINLSWWVLKYMLCTNRFVSELHVMSWLIIGIRPAFFKDILKIITLFVLMVWASVKGDNTVSVKVFPCLQLCQTAFSFILLLGVFIFDVCWGWEGIIDIYQFFYISEHWCFYLFHKFFACDFFFPSSMPHWIFNRSNFCLDI